MYNNNSKYLTKIDTLFKIDFIDKNSFRRVSSRTALRVAYHLIPTSASSLFYCKMDEIEDREHPNEFIPVPPNVNDNPQRWTNNVLKAGIHRVTVPNGMRDGGKTVPKERLLMAHFFKAEREASVGPIQ